MKFASALTCKPDAGEAVTELLDDLTGRLGGVEADMALLFSSAHYEDDLEQIVGQISRRLPNATLIGCTAEGTIGFDREVQRSCSISLLAGSMPGVSLRPIRLTQERMAELDTRQDWESALGIERGGTPLVVALGDPFSFHIQHFLETTNQVLGDVPIVGGMASAAEQPGQNLLILEGELYREGLVGISMTGNVGVRTVVSQGCRPIGLPYVVTRCENNRIFELGGKSALDRLRETWHGLPQKDQVLAQQSVFVGRVINEYQESFDRGDFLIHNIIGADNKAGSISIAALAQTGSTVQFHVRDAGSADDDLRELLTHLSPDCGVQPPAAAMLFSCNGRGIRMWPQQQGHDVTVVREVCGPVPVAGFFAAGELGPVGGQNFIHGFTASIALLSPVDA